MEYNRAQIKHRFYHYIPQTRNQPVPDVLECRSVQFEKSVWIQRNHCEKPDQRNPMDRIQRVVVIRRNANQIQNHREKRDGQQEIEMEVWRIHEN